MITSISCGGSLLLIAFLVKKLSATLVLDAMGELPLSLMVKSVFPLSVVAESERPVGVAASVGTPPIRINHDPS